MADEAAHHEEVGESCGEKAAEPEGSRPSRRRLLAELKDLRDSLEKERKRSEEYLIQIKYLQADFDNYSKRLKKDLEEQVKRGSERLIVKLLPILDDLERAVETSGGEDNPLRDGVKMILKRLKDTLSEEGLSEIDALGKQFDPLKHEAVGEIITSEHPEGVILKVLRRGYIFDGRVLRPSLVEVSKSGQQTLHDHKKLGENDGGEAS
ncbi:MAG: nucleotide exchange factor GrpE [Candidatus Bathyarchaeia archaeon]